MEAPLELLVQTRHDPSALYDPSFIIPKFHRVIYYTTAAMIASAINHPLDYTRARIMTVRHPYSMTQMARRIYRLEGPMTFYWGLKASLLRQFLNSGVRYTAYNMMYDSYKKEYGARPNLRDKLTMGLTAGCAGALVGTPAEVLLTRIMASSAPRAYNGCKDLQGLINNRYKGILDGVNRIVKEEGFRMLWRGGILVQARSVTMTTSSIGVYETVRDLFKRRYMMEGYSLHVAATCITSFVTSILTIPIDIVKTRYQTRRYGVTPKMVYDLIVERRGRTFFWKKPLPPYYFRQLLHSLVSFFLTEEFSYYFEGETISEKEMKKEQARKAEPPSKPYWVF